jgi:hypothetical protein
VGKKPLGRPRRRWENNNNMDLHEDDPCGLMGGPTDMTKLRVIVAFRDSANAHKNRPQYQKRDKVYYKVQITRLYNLNEHIFQYAVCILTLRLPN